MKKSSLLRLLLPLGALFAVTGVVALPSVGEARHHRGKKTESSFPSQTYPTVEATLASMRMDRPPRTSFEVNFTLSNPTPGPRWFLVPLALPLKTGNQISHFEEHRATAKHADITVGRTLGLWAFTMVLVAPQSKVKLQRQPIAYWGDAPQGTLNFEVIVTADLKIGNKPAQQWFTSDPTLRHGTEIKGEKLQLSTTKRAAPGQTTVAMLNDLHVKLALSLSPK